MMNKKLWWIFGIVVLGAAVGSYFYIQHHRYKHFAIHEEGKVYRSAWLAPDVLNEVIEEYGIRTVVNLCEPNEMGEQASILERQAVSDRNAKLIELPMPPITDPEHPAVEKHLDIIRNQENYPMLVHCQHGVLRTAKFIGMYDILLKGKTAEQTLNFQPLFGRPQHIPDVQEFVRNFEKFKNAVQMDDEEK